MTSETVLLIVTSHADLGDTGKKTGFWYEELAAPYYVFKDAGLAPILVSPKGGCPPTDPGSESPDVRGPSVERFAADSEARAALERTFKAEDAPADYAAVFLVGGHGTMWDFPDWPGLSQLLGRAHADDKPIGAVCHGVAGLLSLRTDGGHPLVRGMRLTGFTNDEEAAVGLTGVVPFLLQDQLGAAGGHFVVGAAFSEHVVTDGRLVTGQNPASSKSAAEKVLALLGRN
ncbi:type 1 glutamine amidotransferase domain-containing protein [Chelatococcus asaccharovorans]|uniref:type 1 glutamine amidotransferase domain-containing protein n=1 Tax=Chelatococcus asaccharovorans TaxID=28210 RepID=UPI00224C6CBF|nr:type 1 glutamine amidotransferase domain-containing protein [Chelatococcus asaccharovorans]CAH1668948.1 putative intracellular protease/amidase [Chelatococcus asaccharovorans]CAH1679631.1 putative intracellular protease/amidase [Chelatococcus asaccharovorans]